MSANCKEAPPMWRVARSLDKLLAEVNKAAPNRSKRADGSIGDAAHASRHSDHNPWIKRDGVGIVRARDFTHDPKDGFDAHAFAERLRKKCRRMRRFGGIKQMRSGGYIISNRLIASQRTDWRWVPYGGSNPHEHHVHVSVGRKARHYDSRRRWGMAAKPKPRYDKLDKAVRPGRTHPQVKSLQRLLNKTGYGPLVVDGVYGRKTQKAVARFHERNPRFKNVRRGRDRRIGRAGFRALQIAAAKRR